MRKDEVFHYLQVFIRRQYAVNSEPMMRAGRDFESADYRLDPRLLAFLHAEGQGICEILQTEIEDASASGEGALLRLFVLTTQDAILRRNQFIAIPGEEQAALRQLYVEYLADVAQVARCAAGGADVASMMRAAVARHVRALRAFIDRLAAGNGLAGQRLVQERVTCAEYAAQMQMGVLGIEVQRLAEPILDVGCGREGTLVEYLHRQGLEAYGLDRSAAPSVYTFKVDWLQFSFSSLRWGTIISHMAFSNHFIYQHLYCEGHPEVYARLYMDMLRSLKPGGAMYYAPGLPFVERLLPEASYAVVRREAPLPRDWQAQLPPGHVAALGGNPLYAACVIRVP
jgi:hypothetical protein